MRNFREEVEKGLGAAVILAGSGSDEVHITKLADALKKYAIPFDLAIASGHKQPQVVLGLVNAYDNMNGPLAYVAVAGMTDALSGILSYHSIRPVISCPPDAPNNTCLTNPSGSSNATIYSPANAARFLAQMFSHLNPEYARIIREGNESKEKDLRVAEKTLREKILGEKA